MHTKWGVLAVYSLVAGLSQFLWLNFAPLISLVVKRYGVSEDSAGLLLLVFPLLYVVLSIPAGALIDRRGYRFGIGLGMALMVAFACLRVLDLGFGWLLFTQVGIAAGQPFVINGITALVLDWFDKREGAVANGIGTVGMFLGMAAGLAGTPPLVESIGLTGALAVFAAISVLLGAAFWRVVRPNPDRAAQATVTESPIRAHLRAFLGDRDLTLVFILSFLGLGFFNGLTTWLEPILAPFGINSVQAGVIGGALIVGGIAGAGVIPALSDRLRRRKPFLIGSVGVALLLTYPLCQGGQFNLLLLLGAGLGFFFLPAYAIMLEMASELAGPARVGAATGVLMMTGNAGGVIVILAMQWVKSDRLGYTPAVYLMMALLAVAALLAALVRETHPSRRSATRARDARPV